MTETRAGAGAEEFTLVYRAERNRLRRVAYLMTGQSAVAEELVHDAFVRLHQRWAAVDVPAAYLRTTLIHLCLVWRDRMAMGRARESGRPPGRTARDRRDLGLAGDAPPRPAGGAGARLLRGLAVVEIARVMGCRPATAGTRIHRALAKLREKMTP
jgi:DNA-directed RNA polymerase specialized sigma24 family protein